jgi:hypothetical protein
MKSKDVKRTKVVASSYCDLLEEATSTSLYILPQWVRDKRLKKRLSLGLLMDQTREQQQKVTPATAN